MYDLTTPSQDKSRGSRRRQPDSYACLELRRRPKAEVEYLLPRPSMAAGQGREREGWADQREGGVQLLEHDGIVSDSVGFMVSTAV